MRRLFAWLADLPPAVRYSLLCDLTAAAGLVLILAGLALWSLALALVSTGGILLALALVGALR
jgi:hypothetical protein